MLTIAAMPASLKRLLISTIAIFGGVYLVLSAYFYTRQNDFIFFPQREIMSTPQDDGCEYADVRIPVAGQQMHAWWLPASKDDALKVGGRTLLYAHGNGGNVGANSEHACRLNRMGFAVLIFDYRGYGESDPPPNGKLSERTIYADGEAAWQFLISAKQTPPKSIILYGHSLGGAVAIELAKRHPDAGGVIVESTFTSLLDIADNDALFRFFPVALMLDLKMANEDKLREIRMPVLVIHGAADSLIPAVMAERLYAAAASENGRKQIFIAPQADHGDVAATAGTEYGRRIAGFLQTAAPGQ